MRINASCSGVLLWGVKEAIPSPTLKSRLGKAAEQGPLELPGALYSALSFALYMRRIRFAMHFARKRNIPLLRLEDGFVRSLDLGVRGAPPLSIVCDTTGMYYDATAPSDLENLLASDWEPNEEELRTARESMERIRRNLLSKYNHAPALDPSCLPQGKGPRILLLDQTEGDVSIIRGLASAESFMTMLGEARRAHPGALLCVKTHPDVLSGKKRGFLPREVLGDDVLLFDRDVAPLSLLASFDEVYTVTSQMGFEALLLGLPVHCFGLPFYAGWGLTHDYVASPRRTRSRSLEALFVAAYIRYAKYRFPGFDGPAGILDVLTLLSTQRRLNEANRGAHACLGFRRWKMEHARAFLSSTGGTVEFFDEASGALSWAAARGGSLVVWASKEETTLEERCRSHGIPLIRMEDGFLRSVGLGSNFFRPASLVFDDLGIYYDPGRPSRLEAILREERTPRELAEAEALAGELVARGISKYNVNGNDDLPSLPDDRPILLVPGQVEDDASVRRGGLGIHTNADLLKAVRASRPEAYILFKEHPDVVSGNRVGRVPEELLSRLADGVVRTCPIERVLSLCHEVHTLTSLTGFEALLRGIPVTTYGGPFYAGWGLTCDRHTFPRRRPLPSIWHLVAGTLLVYPRYYDWNEGMFVTCRSCIQWLAKKRSSRYNS
ncbi:MAG: capsular polysaccharide biosynthesis protein [Desulfovibrio sp.]|nr:capsular polysaccharide biosynthesis protein [Desulfovibrio sp.]